LLFAPAAVLKSLAAIHPGHGTARDVHALRQKFEWF
jgi:hypothetical protein